MLILISGCVKAPADEAKTTKELVIDSPKLSKIEVYIQNNLKSNIKIIKEEDLGTHKRIFFEENGKVKRVIIHKDRYNLLEDALK